MRMMPPDQPETALLTVEEVALRLRVKPGWVYRHARALGGLRVGKYVRFYWPTVLDCLNGTHKKTDCQAESISARPVHETVNKE